MKYTCSLCGGKLKDGVCTECGMDNRKSDEMYRNCLNRSKYDHTSMGTMSHVNTEEGAENYKQPVLNENRNKSTGKSKGENPRKNSAADWKTMAGTALPKKQERRGGYKSTDLKNIKGFSSASVQKKNQPSKLIALAILIAVVILVMLGLSMASFIGQATDNGSSVVNYEYVEVLEEIPAQGEHWDNELPAGMYMVGVDIPEGEYVVSGQDGSSFEVHDSTHSIYYQESFGTEEYEIEQAEGVPLFKGALVCVDGMNPVSFASENAQTQALESRISNPLAEAVDATGIMTAGVDFPAGTYDIQPTGDNFGYITYEIPYEDPYSEGEQSYYSFGIMLEREPSEEYPEYSSAYRNVVLPEGAIVNAEDYSCQLVPSSSIISEDYQSYYENMY